jgi:DNA-binding MarR family transcriptional regulator
VLRRRFLLALAPYRVSLPQYNVLRILRGAGGGPLASSVIADRMIEQALGVTSLLERMDAMGWIGRDRAAPPGLVAYQLTSAGAGVLAQVDPVLEAECAAVMAVLSCGTRDALAEALRQLREGGG